MATGYEIDVASLDDAHRRAFDDMIGTRLRRNQRLLVTVTGVDTTSAAVGSGCAQSISDWTEVYSGLTEEQMYAIDRDVKTRANLTRHSP